MSSTSIIAATGSESARTRAVVLLPAAGGPVSSRVARSHSCTTLAHLPPVRHSGRMSSRQAQLYASPGGGGRARSVSAAGGPSHVRDPRREHHVPARQRRRAAPGPGAPTAAPRPRGRLRGGDPFRDRLAPGDPRRHRAGRAAPLSASDGSRHRRGVRGRRDPVCSVLRWMDGRIHESSPRPVHLARLGAADGQLHVQADAWTPPADFVRIHWDHETFFGDVMVYGNSPAAECWDLLPSGCGPVSRRSAIDWPMMPRSAESGSSTPICTLATRSSRPARSS